MVPKIKRNKKEKKLATRTNPCSQVSKETKKRDIRRRIHHSANPWLSPNALKYGRDRKNKNGFGSLVPMNRQITPSRKKESP